jgi:hypothetical protein
MESLERFRLMEEFQELDQIKDFKEAICRGRASFK